MSGSVSLVLALVLAAGALATWPPPPAALRLAVPAGPPASARVPGAAVRRPPTVVVGAIGVGLVALLAGPGGAGAALVLGTVVLRARRARRREQDARTATAGLADGLAAFAAELRAGRPPALAAAAAGRDATAACARALGLVEATARLGGDVPAALRRHAGSPREAAVGPHLLRLAEAWSLADRHGIALAGLTATVAEDLRARSRFATRLAAALAGPRTTASVLAGLPAVGLGLGQLIGADPWSVLTGSSVGQILLVVGAVFVAAGLEWSARITARVVR